MQESYWRYVCVWGEEGEWVGWKERVANLLVSRELDDIVEIDTAEQPIMRDGPGGGGSQSDNTSTTSTTSTHGKSPTEDDERAINVLCDTDYYNPLQDTRPYYYATYNDVRGASEVYENRDILTDSKKYIIDSTKGDEYQLNVRTGTASFMDILNHNVVFQTQKRVYGNFEPPPDSEWETGTFKGQVKWYEREIDTLVG